MLTAVRIVILAVLSIHCHATESILDEIVVTATKFSMSTNAFRADFSGTTDGGYKDDSGFDQQKLLLKHYHETDARDITTSLPIDGRNVRHRSCKVSVHRL